MYLWNLIAIEFILEDGDRDSRGLNFGPMGSRPGASATGPTI